MRGTDREPVNMTAATAEPEVKAGSVIGKCMPARTIVRKFLDEAAHNVLSDLDLHVVMDKASSGKTALIKNWFAKRPHWHMHFTPTSSSWTNQIERFLALGKSRSNAPLIGRSSRALR